MPRKGADFEREVCGMLSMWWTGGKSDAVFWRTANSGGRATVRGRKSKKTNNQHGDICATDPIGQPFVDLFTVEIKRGYSRHTIHDLLDRSENGAEPVYQGWFTKAQKTSEDAGAQSWVLIVKRDRREAIIYARGASLIWHDGYPLLGKHLEIDTDTGIVVGVLLKDFLDWADPKDFEALDRCRKQERKRKQA